jgi:hypothetical protein
VGANIEPENALIKSSATQKLSASQMRFNQLTAQVEQAKLELQNAHNRADFVRDQLVNVVEKTYELATDEKCKLLLMIDELILKKRELGRKFEPEVSERRLRLMREYFIFVAQPILHDQSKRHRYAQLESAFERISGQSWSDFENDGLEALKSMFETNTGNQSDAVDSAQSFEELIEALQKAADAARASARAEDDAFYAQFEAEERQHEQRREDARATKAKARAAQKQAIKEQELREAKLASKQSLRDLMRKLVSALHPDREPDDSERMRKTELMKRVNDAFERSDLLALLSLQLEIEQIAVADIAKLSDARIQQYNLVLEDQLQTLRTQQAQLRQQILQWLLPEHGPVYLSGSPSSNANLDKLLKQLIKQAQEAVADVQQEIHYFTTKYLRSLIFDRWSRRLKHAKTREPWD